MKCKQNEHPETEADSVGCTAVVTVITPDKIICANAGDSRALICRKGMRFQFTTIIFIQYTNSTKQRILNALTFVNKKYKMVCPNDENISIIVKIPINLFYWLKIGV